MAEKIDPPKDTPEPSPISTADQNGDSNNYEDDNFGFGVYFLWSIISGCLICGSKISIPVGLSISVLLTMAILKGTRTWISSFMCSIMAHALAIPVVFLLVIIVICGNM